MNLTPAEKLAWFYIKDQCDNVGVWKPNFKLAEFQIGSQLDWGKFAEKCNGNVKVMDNGKWWIVDFIDFQHPDLIANPDGGNSNALNSYVRELKAHGLYQAFLDSCPSDGLPMPFSCPSDGPKEKARVKARVKEKRGAVIKHPKAGVPMSSARYSSLCEQWGAARVDEYIQRCADWVASKGKPYKDYAAAAAQWLKRDYPKGPPQKTGPVQTLADKRREVFGE